MWMFVGFAMSLVVIYSTLRAVDKTWKRSFLGWLADWGRFLMTMVRFVVGNSVLLLGIGIAWAGALIAGDEQHFYLPEDRPHS